MPSPPVCCQRAAMDMFGRGKCCHFRDKDDEDRVNLRGCPHAQTLPRSLQSAPSSKYLCADTLAWWNHRIQRWCLHQHFCQRALVVNSKTSLAFFFLRPAGISHLWRVTRAWPRRWHLQNHTVSTASVASASLLASNVCMYIRPLLHDPHFATFSQESYRRPLECSCQCPRMTWSKLKSALQHGQTYSSGNTIKFCLGHNFISVVFISVLICCANFCSTGSEAHSFLFPLSPYSSRLKPSNTLFRQNSFVHDFVSIVRFVPGLFVARDRAANYGNPEIELTMGMKSCTNCK